MARELKTYYYGEIVFGNSPNQNLHDLRGLFLAFGFIY